MLSPNVGVTRWMMALENEGYGVIAGMALWGFGDHGYRNRYLHHEL